MLQSHFSLDISARYFEIALRSRLSRHERVWCGEIALRSRRGVDISTRYFAISPRWWLSRPDLGDLGAISARLPRSHRGLLFSARYFEISPRSWLSRRDLADLGEIAAISPRSRSNFYKGNIKCGLSLKIAVLTNKYQKMLLFQFSPALLSCRRPNLAFPAV